MKKLLLFYFFFEKSSIVDLYRVLKTSLSWRRSQSYRNQSIDLHSKPMDWFLYDSDLELIPSQSSCGSKFTWVETLPRSKLAALLALDDAGDGMRESPFWNESTWGIHRSFVIALWFLSPGVGFLFDNELTEADLILTDFFISTFGCNVIMLLVDFGRITPESDLTDLTEFCVAGLNVVDHGLSVLFICDALGDWSLLSSLANVDTNLWTTSFSKIKTTR